LPADLAVGDKVYVEYEVDKIAEQNILKYLEVLEKVEISEAPAITLEVYEGPVYVEKDSVCYYRIRAAVTGKPAPEISWSRDDSGGSLGADKVQIDLKGVDEKYTLEATAKNSEGTAKDKVEIKWGCEKPPTNRPPEIKEIVITEDFYTGTKYPVYVVATDPDGDELSYKWSASAGTVDKSTSNPMFWTTPASAGTYEVKVVVDDGNDGVATKAKNVAVKQKETPPEPPEEEITDVIWQWERFTSNDGSETVVSDPNQYMLLLASDGNMYLLADCNSGSGTYTMKNSSLTLNIEVVTRAVCGPGSLSDQYISYLGDVASYLLENGKLYLNLKADAGNMVFRNVEITPF
jgi:heat shock protein HslJ